MGTQGCQRRHGDAVKARRAKRLAGAGLLAIAFAGIVAGAIEGVAEWQTSMLLAFLFSAIIVVGIDMVMGK